MSVSLSDIAILNIDLDLNYCCIISLIIYINLMQNADLTEKSGTL